MFQDETDYLREAGHRAQRDQIETADIATLRKILQQMRIQRRQRDRAGKPKGFARFRAWRY